MVNKYENTPNILLTGGHAATAGIALIEEIKSRFPKAKISWIGSKTVVSGSNATSLEYKIYPSLGVEYHSINAGKLQTKFTRYTIPLLLMIPVGFFQALFLLLKIKPAVVFSFGGFSAYPVVFWAWVLGIPVILHEQTVAAGRANMASAFFAKKIALARGESINYFPKSKSVITGNPLSREILSVKPKTKPGTVKTILIVGGSRGSEFINEEVSKIIPELRQKYKIIHIVGERDFGKYKDKGEVNYTVLPFVNPTEMARHYEEADLVIGRSGANTVSELLYIKRPSILIPLPRTFMNEQYKNAKYAEEFGIAKVIPETEINPQSLLKAITGMFADWEKIVQNTKTKESPDAVASQKVADIIEQFI